ncbi:hypothetical protein SADUNF_Sadunf12G0063200 [Salix dunnii]|uniref:CCHC-type domain-containing protein n=1 Tax=Salix dunnii TaxID=1413687 RepID=A0A835JND7_9ROSI|nr:hypothetical protein SADUNF_Sadunf12G0063200 [Salix dunnii]
MTTELTPQIETPSQTESPSPIIHVQTENPGFNAGVILTETNYDTWSQIIEMQIAGREKLDYIIGNSPQPDAKDPSYSKWYAENQKIKGWLLTSMNSEIMKRYLRLRTAREIWSALAKAFYDGSDETKIFALNQRAFSIRQSNRPLPTYYGELVEIFQELDYRDNVKMRDPEDLIMYKRAVEKLRIHIFLNGLDTEFEQVQGEILRMDPSLDLESSYAYVRREANRRHLLNKDLTTPDSMAMLAHRNTPARHSGSMATSRSFDIRNKPVRNFDSGSKHPGSTRYCTHCGDTGHTKIRCYELIGYPEWWDPSKAPQRKGKASPATSSSPSTSIAIAGKSSPNTDANALHTTSETPGTQLDQPTPSESCEWIIDSGSTDHMSSDMPSISELKPSGNHVVSTANGTQVKMFFSTKEAKNAVEDIGEGNCNIQSLNYQTEILSPQIPEHREAVIEPTEHRETVIEPTTFELQENDQRNTTEATVPQLQSSSPLDAPSPHEPPPTGETQVTLEPSLCILPNRTTREYASYTLLKSSLPKFENASRSSFAISIDWTLNHKRGKSSTNVKHPYLDDDHKEYELR